MSTLLASHEPSGDALAKVELCERSFGLIAGMLRKEAGIALEPHKRTLVRSRLLRRLRAQGVFSFEEYLELVERNDEERELMVAALTTNHTKFFREAHHLEQLAAWRQRYADRLRAGESLSIWSAASSSGQEAYSIAMALAGPNRTAAAPFLTDRFRILGTDIAPHAVAAARAAVYPQELLADIPPDLRKAWTIGRPDGFAIAPDLAARTRFNRLNLMGAWPFRRRFAVIFCRNVMIYFDEPTKARLLERLADALEPGGLLFIGHSERLLGPVERRFRAIGHTAFCKEGGA